MAVVVIKKATEKPHKITCVSCGDQLEYLTSDVQTYHRGQISDPGDSFEYIECPTCSKRVVIRNF